MKQFFLLVLYLNIYTIISEGVSAQVLQLEIETESEANEAVIDSLNITNSFGNFKSLKDRVDSLSIRFRKLGFLEAEQTELLKKNDSVYIARYQLKNRWKSLRINYQTSGLDISEVKRVSNQFDDTYLTIPIVQIENILSAFNQIQINKGDPFAKLALSDLKVVDDQLIEASLYIEQSTVRTIDEIVIKGYDKFPRSFLKYYIGLKKGSTFVREDLVRKSELLENLGFVNSTKSPEALFRKDSTAIYLYLEKRNNNLFDGILGFATNEETNKIELNGYLNLELNNNLNFGEQLLINYKADGREQQNFRTNLQMPYLFKSPFGIELELKIFKRDSTFSTTQQQARLSYQLNPRSKAFVGYKNYESSNLLDETVVGDVSDYNASFLLLGATYTKLQRHRFFPIQTMIGIETEIGSRTADSMEQEQFRLQGSISHIFNLNLSNAIYLRNESALLSSDTYLTNELYRFGGINSIRGFSENSIDASVYSVFNTEYRYIFNNSIYLHSIIDFAYFENPVISLQEELYSFGFGFGFLTEAGLFRLNIANGISTEQNFKFSNTKIHLSLSSRF